MDTGRFARLNNEDYTHRSDPHPGMKMYYTPPTCMSPVQETPDNILQKYYTDDRTTIKSINKMYDQVRRFGYDLYMKTY